jgi:colanic acid/amylovoran biosynthesis protein
MKYALVHCYTDKNKGDAAIIIATTQLINDTDDKAEISLHSTYGYNDLRLKTEHIIISKYAKNIFPALFPEPLIPFSMKIEKLRALIFFISFIKSFLMLISKNKIFLGLFLKQKELNAFSDIVNSDVIISKGGSFLCTENSTIRQSLSLIRMLYPFVLAKRYGKKNIIFSQSIGPVVGSFNTWLFKKVLLNVDKIYLRESLCYEKYTYVREVCQGGQYEVIPDSAFYLKSDNNQVPISINKNSFNVGFTLVDHDFKYISSMREREAKSLSYKESIIKAMKHLIDSYDAQIYIYPQVQVDISIDGHNDMRISSEITQYFKGTKYEKNIYFYNENWTPIELRNLYSLMDIFIGTRLHSVIFSLSVGTPAINIAYHGTKSQGILAGLTDYDKYVVDINTISSNNLNDIVDNLISNKDRIKIILSADMLKIQNILFKAVKNI